MTIYTLVCQNNSSRSGAFCGFQQDPTLGVSGAMSVAWLVQLAHPTTTVTFEWSFEYDFVWSETGKLSPDVLVTSAQVWSADLELENQIGLTYLDGAFTFENQTQGAQAGTLYIVQDQTIPPDLAAAGIGMAGAATFVVQSQPNVTLAFTPDPQLWITFGDYTRGQVLDVDAITDKQQIDFPVNVYSMTAILESDNTWTIAPTSEVNKAFLAARDKDPSVLWGVHEI